MANNRVTVDNNLECHISSFMTRHKFHRALFEDVTCDKDYYLGAVYSQVFRVRTR